VAQPHEDTVELLHVRNEIPIGGVELQVDATVPCPRPSHVVAVDPDPYLPVVEPSRVTEREILRRRCRRRTWRSCGGHSRRRLDSPRRISRRFRGLRTQTTR
jgi:hypothetical protein